MAEKRMIYSRIWEDEFIGGLDFFQRLLWMGLITRCADDQGRMLDNPTVIRSQVFPYDDISAQSIDDALTIYQDAGKIIRYSANGKRLIQLVKWWENQALQWAMPSKYPAPPTWTDHVRYQRGNQYITENWGKVDNPPGQPTWTAQVDTPPDTTGKETETEKKQDNNVSISVDASDEWQENDPFELNRIAAETMTGIMATPGDMDVIRKWSTDPPDKFKLWFANALQWRKDNNKPPVKCLRYMDGSYSTAKLQAIQAASAKPGGNNGYHPRNSKPTNEYREPTEAEIQVAREVITERAAKEHGLS